MANILEICCDTIQSALDAAQNGADRIELCENLAQGGVTPSAAKIKLTKEKLDIPVFVLIRPRKADFLYDDLEFQLMIEDIVAAKQLGADGIVSGILKADGQMDFKRMAQLVKIAHPLPFTCHRAFDMCVNADLAIEGLVDIGVKRILTSGQEPTATLGRRNLSRFAEIANGRISIMACGELLPENIDEILSIPGIYEYHSAVRKVFQSKMKFRGHTNMGDEAVEEEFQWHGVDPQLVKGLREKLG